MYYTYLAADYGDLRRFIDTKINPTRGRFTIIGVTQHGLTYTIIYKDVYNYL